MNPTCKQLLQRARHQQRCAARRHVHLIHAVPLRVLLPHDPLARRLAKRLHPLHPVRHAPQLHASGRPYPIGRHQAHHLAAAKFAAVEAHHHNGGVEGVLVDDDGTQRAAAVHQRPHLDVRSGVAAAGGGAGVAAAAAASAAAISGQRLHGHLVIQQEAAATGKSHLRFRRCDQGSDFRWHCSIAAYTGAGWVTTWHQWCCTANAYCISGAVQLMPIPSAVPHWMPVPYRGPGHEGSLHPP